MNNQKKEYSHIEDKCSNCGTTDTNTFWDYDDGSILCDKCHRKIGDEWEEKIQTADIAEADIVENEDDEENEDNENSEDYEKASIKNTYKKSKPKFSSDSNTNVKKYVIGGAVFIVALILIFSVKTMFAWGTNSNVDYSTNQAITNLATNGNVATGSGSVQNAKLALVDFSYKLTPNKLMVGVPVRIEVDASTLSGCMKTVVIRDFGVSKYIKPGDNIIEFTPDKTGIFWITCSMGMGAGSFEVVNSDGTSDPNVKAQATAPKINGGSCGVGGGGCGCGG